MTVTTFAPWVEPIAAELRRSRSGIAEVARSIPKVACSRPSPDPGWSCKDLLAHLAVGDWLCQTVLRAAVGKERFDMAISAELDSRNARLIEERRDRSVQDLIAEVAAEGKRLRSFSPA